MKEAEKHSGRLEGASADMLPRASRRARSKHHLWLWLALVSMVVSPLCMLVLKAYLIDHEVRLRIADLEAAGEPVGVLDLVPAPVPDEDNGALDVEAAILLLPALSENDERFWRDLTPFTTPVPSDDDIERTRAILDFYRPAIDRAGVGLAKPAFAWSHYRAGNVFMPENQTRDIRRLVRAMTTKASVSCLDGRGNDAASEALDVLRLARALGSEPSSMYQMMCVGFRNGARRTIEETLARTGVSPGALRELSTAFAATPEEARKAIVWALRTDRILYIFQADALIAGKMKPPGLGDMPPSVLVFTGARTPWGRAVIRADELLYLRIMNERISDLDRPSVRIPPGAWKETKFPWYASTAAFSEANYSSSLPAAIAHAHASMRTAAIGLEVAARLGEGQALPSDLSFLGDDLRIDPYTGNSLRLKYDADMWIVYSVGPNLKDEGGTWMEPKYGRSFGDRPDDIAFRVPLAPPSS